jgi:hypothetical protein
LKLCSGKEISWSYSNTKVFREGIEDSECKVESKNNLTNEGRVGDLKSVKITQLG